VHDLHSGHLAQSLKSRHELQSADRGKAISIHEDCLVAVHDLLFGPTFHLWLEQFKDLRLTCPQELKRTVRKDHAEAEGRAARILLEDEQLVPRA
jgi:hypothetical protein